MHSASGDRARIQAMSSLKFPAVQVEQPGGTFYVLTMPSNVLERIAYVSVRARENPEGVQRYLSEKRVREVRDFVNAPEALLANNIIVNLSGEARFARSNGLHGVLHIPDRPGEAMVIDGQHRLFGFRESPAQLELTVSAFIGLALHKQAKLFRDINTQQKGIPTSLAYDLLDLTKDAEFVDLRSHEIVKRLNEEPDSPWYQSIKMQGVGAGLVTQGAFIERLKTHVGSNGSIGYLDAEPQYQAICNYWRAVKEVQSDAWGARGYLLTKTLGFSALMDVFSRVAEKCLESRNFKVSNLKQILSPLASFDFSSQALRGFAGSRGRIELRERLLAVLSLQAKPKAELIQF